MDLGCKNNKKGGCYISYAIWATYYFDVLEINLD